MLNSNYIRNTWLFLSAPLGTTFARALLVEVYYPREALVELLLRGKVRNMWDDGRFHVGVKLGLHLLSSAFARGSMPWPDVSMQLGDVPRIPFRDVQRVGAYVCAPFLAWSIWAYPKSNFWPSENVLRWIKELPPFNLLSDVKVGTWSHVIHMADHSARLNNPMSKHALPAFLVLAFTLDETGRVGRKLKKCCLAGPSKLLQGKKTFAAFN